MLHAVGLINVSIRAEGKRVSEEVLGTTRMIIGNLFYLIVLDRRSGKFQPKHPHGRLESGRQRQNLLESKNMKHLGEKRDVDGFVLASVYVFIHFLLR